LPAPAILLGVRPELEGFEGALDHTEVCVGVDVADQQDVDVCRAEVLRDDASGVSCQDGRHQAAEDDEEGCLVAYLMQQSDQRALGSRACLW
jgi:hypothetical protein